MYDPYNDNQNPYEPNHEVSGQYTPYNVPAPRPEKKGVSGGKLVALAVSCSLLGGIVGAGAMSLLGGNSVSNITEGQRPSTHAQSCADVQKSCHQCGGHKVKEDFGKGGIDGI